MISQLKKVDSPLIKEVRGMGLWIGVDLDKCLISAREVCERMLLKGVVSKDTHETVIRFAPPLTITKEEIDFALQAFEITLKDIEKTNGLG